jgi:AcrR family transcriptional regulator
MSRGAAAEDAGVAPPSPPRRRYDNTLRRERAALTRERIIAAGAEVIRDSSIRDWRALTIRGVAERARVNERTVFRHFPNERSLRDTVMHRLEQEAGVDLTALDLDGISDATARILRHVSLYPSDPRPELDPTLAEAGRRQHQALLSAVKAGTIRWPESDRVLAAAMFDVMWAVTSYERLVTDWQLDPNDAIRGITWVTGLIREAISEGRRPREPRRKRRS